jgi:linoleoyl-CoA desaturase
MSKITFNNKYSPFFDAVKENVESYFHKHNIKVTGNSRLYTKTVVLLTSGIGLYIFLVFFTPHYLIAAILCALLGFVIASIGFNVMHDGAHGSYSGNKKVNKFMSGTLNVMGGSSFMWNIKHNLIHHSYTNIEGADDDIANSPWLRLNENQPRYWFHRFQHIYFIILYGLSYLLWVFVLDFQKYFRGRIAEMKLRKMSTKETLVFWGSKLVYMGLFIILPVLTVGAIPTLVGYLILAFVCGVTTSTVFQLAHIVEETKFPEPHAETRKVEQEWAVHQVVTTANFSTRSKLVSWIVGGLNFQIEHHLFPRISHIHYPEISKVVKQTCAKFNVHYMEFPNTMQALKSHISHLKAMGQPQPKFA